MPGQALCSAPDERTARACVGVNGLRLSHSVLVVRVLLPGVFIDVAEVATAYRAQPGRGFGGDQDSAGLLEASPEP